MSPARMGKIESAIRVVLAFNEAFNRHDIDAMLRLISDDCVFEYHTPAPSGAVYTGMEEISHFWQGFFQETPQARVKIEEIFGYDVRCIMRWRLERQDSAEKQGTIRGVDIFKTRDDLICEQFSYIKGHLQDETSHSIR